MRDTSTIYDYNYSQVKENSAFKEYQENFFSEELSFSNLEYFDSFKNISIYQSGNRFLLIGHESKTILMESSKIEDLKEYAFELN